MLKVPETATISTPLPRAASATERAWASVMISGIGARPEQAILYWAQVNPAAATELRTLTGSVPSKVFAKMPSFITRHP
ncbi:hypothetical protein ACVIGV_005920 [Rhizobium leguminosarum]